MIWFCVVFAGSISLNIPWTLTTFPSNPEQTLYRCSHLDHRHHVCDPRHLLEPVLVTVLDTRLLALSKANATAVALPKATGKAAAGVSASSCGGFNVFMAILDELDDRYVAASWDVDAAFRAFAHELGVQWHVLGSACGNGVMMVYSVKDHYLTILPDAGHENLFSTDVLRHIVRRALAPQHGSAAHPDETLTIAVSLLELVIHGQLSSAVLTLERSRIFVYSLSCCLGIVVVLGMVCCVYDTLGKWRHRMRFHYCRTKIQRIHDVLLKPTGDCNPLCGICVDFLPTQTRNIVVFLCGHRYHLDCANVFLQDCCKERCPACLLLGDIETHGCSESKAFMLRSLQAMFPDIISHDQVDRWQRCHTESWLSELECPSYESIWQREDD